MTPLTIESYFFPHVNVTANPQFNPAGEKTSDPHFEIKIAVDDASQNGIWQVAMEIFSAAENEEIRQAYNIELVCIGLFKVAPNFAEPAKLLRLNGAALLYSAAREFIITITSRGPWGPIMLPAASFLPKDQHGSATPEGKTPPQKKVAKSQKVKK